MDGQTLFGRATTVILQCVALTEFEIKYQPLSVFQLTRLTIKYLIYEYTIV
jgi:hypothetical protein